MGTKGKKNTPITARINSGLFNQKKSVTEPLLNVGPAGVHGNNKTKDIPSPSKMRGYAKRSPLQKTPNLEPTKVGINMLKTITAPDTIEEVAGTPGTSNYDAAVAAEGTKIVDPKNITQEMTDKANKKRADAKAADAAAAKPKKVVVKGKTSSSNEFTANKTRDKGDAQTSLERRNVIRSGKVAARTEKAAQRKIDKLDRKEGKTTKTKKEQRLERKRTQAESNREVSQNAVKGAKNQSAQNISSRSDKDVFSDERDMTLSEVGGKAAQDDAIKAGEVKQGGFENIVIRKLPGSTYDKNAGVTQEEIDGVAKKLKSPAKKKGFGMKKPLYK